MLLAGWLPLLLIALHDFAVAELLVFLGGGRGLRSRVLGQRLVAVTIAPRVLDCLCSRRGSLLNFETR